MSEKDKATKNREAYDYFVQFASNQIEVTDIIMNGDIYHAPTTGHLNIDERISRIIDILLQMAKKIQKPIHFNLGNHDILMEKKDGAFVPVHGFAEKFEAMLNSAIGKDAEQTGRRLNINLIGSGNPDLGNYQAIYQINVGGFDIQLFPCTQYLYRHYISPSSYI